MHAGSAFYPQLGVLAFSGFDLIKSYGVGRGGVGGGGAELNWIREADVFLTKPARRPLEAHPWGLQRNRAQDSWSPRNGSKWAQPKSLLCPGQAHSHGDHASRWPFPCPLAQLYFINCRLTCSAIKLGCTQEWINHYFQQ